MNTSLNDALATIVSEMRMEDEKNKQVILQKITSQPTLTGKCIMARNNLTPQSTEMENICKQDLKIENPIDEVSGDGRKNGKNYEIKISIHARRSKLNFVQIRPDHNVDYYIFIAYNMYENDSIGQAYIFKISSNNVYDLVIRYGGYAHGTCSVLGKITLDNIKGRNCEYALRCDPNSKKGKNLALWDELKKYEVAYDAANF